MATQRSIVLSTEGRDVVTTAVRDRRQVNTFELDRGVYDVDRAAALSGVPRTTLHYWAREGFYIPSVSPEPRTRLWSWADLLALRAIDWMRGGTGRADRATSFAIRRAIMELIAAGYSAQDFGRVVAVGSGKLFLRLDDRDVLARPGQQGALPNVLPLVSRYEYGPHLLTPRPLLRIMPGKMHGEPHILNTRIPSAGISELHDLGYTNDQIRDMYPDASREAIEQSIEFEHSLLRAA